MLRAYKTHSWWPEPYYSLSQRHWKSRQANWYCHNGHPSLASRLPTVINCVLCTDAKTILIVSLHRHVCTYVHLLVCIPPRSQFNQWVWVLDWSIKEQPWWKAVRVRNQSLEVIDFLRNLLYRSEYDHPSAISRISRLGNTRGDKIREINSWEDFQ